MRQYFTIICALAALATATSAGAQASLVLQGATIIDGTGGEFANGTIVIEDGKIACVGSAADCVISEGSEIVALTGRFITPGLIDAHVHFGQTGWLDGRPDGINAPEVYPYSATIAGLKADPGRWHRAYLCSGTTAVYDVGGQEWTIRAWTSAEATPVDRAHVRTAGPLITHASANNRTYTHGDLAGQDLFLPFDSDDELRAGVERVVGAGGQAIKVWFLDPPPERRTELETRLMLAGEMAREAGLPLIVHATELDNAKAALRAGAAMLVHSVDDKPVDQEFLDLLIANETFYAPTIVVSANWTKAVGSVAIEQPVSIDDPNNCVDAGMREMIANPQRLTGIRQNLSPTRTFDRLVAVGRAEQIMADNLLAVRDAGGRIVLATDAGNPLTLHGPSINYEMEAMQRSGMKPAEIIEAATRIGAQAMGRENEIGTLEAGKVADLIVLSSDPREDVANFRALTHVMRGGVFKTQRELQVFEPE